MKNDDKKLSLPAQMGLVVAALDMSLWACYVYYGLTGPDFFFSEGLMGMWILHFPASALMWVLGGLLLSPFVTSASVAPQATFLFVVGVAQYYLIGYLLGKLFLFVRKISGK